MLTGGYLKHNGCLAAKNQYQRWTSLRKYKIEWSKTDSKGMDWPWASDDETKQAHTRCRKLFHH